MIAGASPAESAVSADSVEEFFVADGMETRVVANLVGDIDMFVCGGWCVPTFRLSDCFQQALRSETGSAWWFFWPDDGHRLEHRGLRLCSTKV